jgi:hypothetical protein
MFLNEFFLQLFLLAVMGLLLLGGIVLLIDACRRMFTNAYNRLREAQTAPPLAPTPIESKENVTVKDAA